MKKKPTPRIYTTDSAGFAANTEPVLVVLEISRQQIESGNYAGTLERLMIMIDTRENVLRYRESLFLQVHGYDADPRELPEIPEVRKFFAHLVSEWPHWLWFLGRKTGVISLLMSLLCDCKIHRANGAFGIEFTNPEQLDRRVTDLLDRSMHMFDMHDIPTPEIQESANSALRALVGE